MKCRRPAGTDFENLHLRQRIGDTWSTARLAFQNALFSNHVFEGGELVKISREEPYDAPRRD